jgi:hypothetical protein
MDKGKYRTRLLIMLAKLHREHQRVELSALFRSGCCYPVAPEDRAARSKASIAA